MDERFFLEKERIPVFIGIAGSKKREIEKKFDCELEIDSDSGEVLASCEDSVSLFVLSNIITAINMGHSPDHAMALENENCVLDVIDVKTYVKESHRLKVVMGRIIGKDGSTRKVIEEITGCSVSVKDHFVSVVGPYENTIIVHEALDMLIKGASHKTLYSFLERNKVNFNDGLL